MARLIDRPFDPLQPVIARRPFVAAGRHWKAGDVFDWRRMAIAPRKTLLLYEAGKLMHPSQPTITPAPTAAMEWQDEDTLRIAAGSTSDEPAATADEPEDDLTRMDMKQLREVAAAEDAPTRTSRAAQREAIRLNRAERAAQE